MLSVRNFLPLEDDCNYFAGGDMIPEEGDVIIGGVSVLRDPRNARFSLGVCPQVTAIDSQLTVREHLVVYGRLKGLKPGEELAKNIESLLVATRLDVYADRLANKLSGGNQRKLSLAISLIGMDVLLPMLHSFFYPDTVLQAILQSFL
jgi:ABC-type multidrug transport system ATPase subunit